MTEFVPPEYQPLVDWCTQPAPAFVGDTHAVHFSMRAERGTWQGIVYQGLMFFVPVVGTAGPYHGPHFVGTGAMGPSEEWATLKAAGSPLPAFWIRIAIALTPGVIADLTWFDSAPGGAPVDGGEYDVVDFQPGGSTWSAGIGDWLLIFNLTTVLVN